MVGLGKQSVIENKDMRFSAFFAILVSVANLAPGGSGLDTARGASDALEAWSDSLEGRTTGRFWLRIRGVGEVIGPEETIALLQNREALEKVRAKGYRVVCMVRWSPNAWTGVRPGGGPGGRAPLNLQEAFERGRRLGQHVGDAVDAWEFENEPDIAFFADTADVFAAYHKAVALGLAAGRGTALGALGEEAVEAFAADPVPPRPFRRDPKRGPNPALFPAASAAPEAAYVPAPGAALVLMAAPGLPPGPHFAQLLANGYLAYTEGFNYHYYGFAMDYPGVYAQFRDAVGAAPPAPSFAPRLGGRTDKGGGGVGRAQAQAWPVANDPSGAVDADVDADAAADARPSGVTTRLPVFLTEWGYSLLDAVEASTTQGRVRQWRFFRDVSLENERLRIAAPMAFLLPPFFEHRMKEFGLTMSPAALDRPERLLPRPLPLPIDAGNNADPARGGRLALPPDPSTLSAAGISFTPADFGANSVEPWMRGIGQSFGPGSAEASPALAWMLARSGAKQTQASRPWTVRTEVPSPVVFDFIAGENTQARKAFNGYWLRGPAADFEPGVEGARTQTGRGLLVAYNFSTLPADVTWLCPPGMAPFASGVTVARATLRLAPGERREIPVVLATQGDTFTPTAIELRAEVQIGGTRTESRWAAQLYPWPDGFTENHRRDFAFPKAEASANRERLLSRPRAPEEPGLHEDGRWLVTDGVRVEETPEGWRLHIDHFPGVGVRPAVAELPLPTGWGLATGEVLAYDYRLTALADAQPLRFDDPVAQRRLQTGRVGVIAECYLRTTDGKLFSAAPRYFPNGEWRRFQQSGETFGMRFLGRTTPPWRFMDNTPAALVFFVRPDRLPAVFEVRDPRVVRWEAAPAAGP